MNLQNYDVTEMLYQSSTTEVHRVREKVSGEKAVIKILRSKHPSTIKVAKFKQEFEILNYFSENQNKSVIKPLDMFFEDHLWIMVLEDFGGVSLSRHNLAGTLSVDSFLGIALQLTEILESVHNSDIIHCDINPSNILINPETKEIKLIDFNIATPFLRVETSFQHPNKLEGTLAYISPEQTGRMNQSIDFRSDLYSLGVTLYELATGVKPFISEDQLELIYNQIALNPESPARHKPDFPEIICQILLKLMAKDANDRYQSVRGLKADLLTCSNGVKNAVPMETFPLGREDQTGTLQLPRKLYGRDQEVNLLLESYRLTLDGEKAMVTISGLPGVGKTSLVKEIHKPITRDKGFFLSGKFDQHKRNTPYFAFIKTMESFVQMIMVEDPSLLNDWKERWRIMASLSQ